MSIVRSLIWLFDHNEERKKREDEKRWQQQLDPGSPDDGPEPPSLQVREGERRYRCKFCGREERQARYCPDCLADTMVPLPDRG